MLEKLPYVIGRVRALKSQKDYFERYKERDFENELQSLLNMLKIISIHQSSGLDKNIVMPDLIAHPLPGLPVKYPVWYMETKRGKKNEESKIQKATNKLLSGYVMIYVTKTWEEVEAMLLDLFPNDIS